MPRFLISVLASIFTASAVLAADNVTTFELDNGMQAVVIEDHRAPVVVHMVWYRVGAADEPPGKSGIAHFLEHLMFKGTDTLAQGEFSKIVAANGGSDNAFTSQDYTAYFQRVAADRLDLMMQMEADRMRNLAFTEEDALTEREVILEERNQRTDSNPGALFGEVRRAALYMNHPYGIPIIGWRHEMETLTRDDALAFYQRFYAPNNAILVVAGDVTPDEVKRLAETHYGPLAPTEGLTKRARPAEPPQIAERRIPFSDPRVAQPYVARSYLMPERDAGNQEEAAALTILAELLGGNAATSFMGKSLQFDTQTAIYTAAFYSGKSYDDTSFGLIVVPSEGVTLAEAETAMDDTIRAFIEAGVDRDALARIKQQIHASQIYERDSLRGQAHLYGEALTQGLTIADIDAWPDILAAVDEPAILAAAKRLLDKRNAVTGWYMREGDTQEMTQ
ncbi:MAG: M16 family metallopeptidase [Brevirhabdus sp.]